MTDLRWTRRAISDLARLHEFLEAANPQAAASVVQSLMAAPSRLLQHPRLGQKLDEFAPREIRRIVVGQYEIRYEVRGSTIVVLRLWHSREDR